MKTCTVCERPECAIEVDPPNSKYLVYLCRDCARTAAAAWARFAGETWSKVTRQRVLEAKAEK